MLKVIAGTTNQPQADLIVERLAVAGITAISQLSSGNIELGASGGRTIYVEEGDVERARALLAAEEPPFSDEELAELSQRAAEESRED